MSELRASPLFGPERRCARNAVFEIDGFMSEGLVLQSSNQSRPYASVCCYAFCCEAGSGPRTRGR